MLAHFGTCRALAQQHLSEREGDERPAPPSRSRWLVVAVADSTPRLAERSAACSRRQMQAPTTFRITPGGSSTHVGDVIGVAAAGAD